jgi:hypothetical protein
MWLIAVRDDNISLIPGSVETGVHYQEMCEQVCISSEKYMLYEITCKSVCNKDTSSGYTVHADL